MRYILLDLAYSYSSRSGTVRLHAPYDGPDNPRVVSRTACDLYWNLQARLKRIKIDAGTHYIAEPGTVAELYIVAHQLGLPELFTWLDSSLSLNKDHGMHRLDGISFCRGLSGLSETPEGIPYEEFMRRVDQVDAWRPPNPMTGCRDVVRDLQVLHYPDCPLTIHLAGLPRGLRPVCPTCNKQGSRLYLLHVDSNTDRELLGFHDGLPVVERMPHHRLGHALFYCGYCFHTINKSYLDDWHNRHFSIVRGLMTL